MCHIKLYYKIKSKISLTLPPLQFFFNKTSLNLSCLNSLHCYEGLGFFKLLFGRQTRGEEKKKKRVREKENIIVETCQP